MKFLGKYEYKAKFKKTSKKLINLNLLSHTKKSSIPYTRLNRFTDYFFFLDSKNSLIFSQRRLKNKKIL